MKQFISSTLAKLWQAIVSLIITLKAAIKKGLIWIFPKPLQNEFTTFQKLLICSILITLLCILCGCGAQRQVAVVDRVSTDTVYLNKVQYDSIYQYDSFLMDYHPSKEFVYLFDSVLVMKVDTMYIRDKKVEYKYKYLRDTTYIHQVDSIPVIKEVEVIKTERYTPKPISILAWIGAISIILFIVYLLIKIKL